MYKTGIFAGKFIPPHRGHMNAIIRASAQCETLYVVVSDNALNTRELCLQNGLAEMDVKMRARWLSQEVQCFGHIRVIFIDESGICFPQGWPLWIARLRESIPQPIEVSFTADKEYEAVNHAFFPEVETVILDREEQPVSATDIRKNPLDHWDYILPSARPFFAKKVLLTGTESCGKTTMAGYLAKIFDTVWSEETGRNYSVRYMGGNEQVFKPQDFDIIASEQYMADTQVLKNANRVVFFDGDAVLTQYYCQMYTGEISKGIQFFVDPQRYDRVLLFTPDVPWVPDGFRFNPDHTYRWQLHDELKSMYFSQGFGPKMHEISGDYLSRLKICIEQTNIVLSKRY